MDSETARLAIREGKHCSTTSGLAPGYEQANLVVLPQQYSFDFIRFCIRNPQACPLLDITEKGSPLVSSHLAKNIDLRTDLPLYRVYRKGVLSEEVKEIKKLWKDDLIAFLLGCSFSFEHALIDQGIGVRHIEESCNVPMYKTNLNCNSAGIFKGKMVVSMRPVPQNLVDKTIEITSKFPLSHGGPVHIGDPFKIGIPDLEKPDYGQKVSVHKGEIPLFWACGVTPQECAISMKLPLMITHAPGHMLILDRKL